MKSVLVIGSGAREHALAWKFSCDKSVSEIYTAPGNDFWPATWKRLSLDLSNESLDEEFHRLAKEVRKNAISLTVVGPDNPLADGLVDIFQKVGCKIFGPTRAAAQIESSKGFAKEVMKAAGVRTALFKMANSLERALIAIDELFEEGVVIKADGLAFGKGVAVCATKEDAKLAAQQFLETHTSILIEKRLFGKEASLMAFCDGKTSRVLDGARDYKRLRNGDKGPNTGGMGAFSPVPGIDARFRKRIRHEVFEPVLKVLRERNASFTGILYAGLMLSKDNYDVLEFNCRFGDPEAQVLLPRLNVDLFEWCNACADGHLSEMPEEVPFFQQSAVTVVAAAKGYPSAPVRGNFIYIPKDIKDHCFFAGMGIDEQRAVVAGGRVLCTLGKGESLEEARSQAYSSIHRIEFEGMQFRDDIAEGGGN